MDIKDIKNVVSTEPKTDETRKDIQKSSRPKILPRKDDIILQVTTSQMDRMAKHVSEIESVGIPVKICRWVFTFSTSGVLTCLLQFFCNGQKKPWIVAALILILLCFVSYIIKSKKDNKDENSINNLKSVIIEISNATPRYNPCFYDGKHKNLKSTSSRKKEGLAVILVVSFISMCVLNSCNVKALNDNNDLFNVTAITIAVTSLLVSLYAWVIIIIEKKKNKLYYDIIDRLKYNDAGDVDASKTFFVLGNSMAMSGSLSDAIVYYTKAINETPDKPDYYEKRAEAYRAMGSIKEAQVDYEKAIDLYKKGSAEKYRIAQLMHELANLFLQTKDVEKAEQHFQDAITLFDEKNNTMDSVQIGEFVDVLNDYGNTLTNINKLTEAELIFCRALDSCERLPKGTEKSMASMAMTLNNMAVLYKKIFKFELATEKYSEALELYRQLAEKDEYAYVPDVAMTLNNLGNLYVTINEYEKAERDFNEALNLFRQLAERDEETYESDVATTLNNLANLNKVVGKYDKAEKEYQEALSIRERAITPEHPDTAQSYNNLGSVLLEQGDHSKALEYYLKALEIREKTLGYENPDTAQSYNNIGSVYDELCDYDKALEYYGKALVIRESKLGKNHPDTATTYNNIAGVYYAKGDYDKALEYYGKALAIRGKVLGTEHPDTAQSYNNIGLVYYQMKKYREALNYLVKALQIRKDILGDDHPNTKNTQRWIDATKAAMSKGK